MAAFQSPIPENTEALLTEIKKNMFSEFADNRGLKMYPSKAGLDAMIARWMFAKGDIIAKLRTHPNWSEKDLAIVLPMSEARALDRQSAERALNKLVLLEKVHPIKHLDLWDYITRSDFFFRESLTNDAANELNQKIASAGIKNLRLGGGQKISRVVRRILLEFGFDEKDRDSNVTFNVYTNAMNETGTPIRFVLSAHPLDYLLMSNGNSWSSCHYFGGCYSSGVASYMSDGISLVGYTIPDAKDVLEKQSDWPLWKIPKRTRQMFMFGDYGILQSRLYPMTHDTDTRSKYGLAVTEIYNKTMGVDTSWVFGEGMNYYNSAFRNASGSTHYPDWHHGYNCRIIRNSKAPRDARAGVIGSQPTCMVCGNQHTNNGYHGCGNEHVQTLRIPQENPYK